MKVGILAGGFGTRLAEETAIRPKPMVEIGTMPILWHIMKIYSAHGINDFAVALGYKGEYIKKWFMDYMSLDGSISMSLRTGAISKSQDETIPDWNVDLVETGGNSMTGGRIKRLEPWICNGETCMVTYGDGVCDVNITKLMEFHRSHGKLATVTKVRPPARFGYLMTEGEQVVDFQEKQRKDEGWINGGYFVLEPGVFDYIDGDSAIFEQEALRGLARDGQLMAFEHEGFWQCMDTLPEKKKLNELWESGKAPWKVWG